VTTKTFDQHVRIRIGTELLEQIQSIADSDGVYVAEWARSAILAAIESSSSAKVPKPAGGGGAKLSIRFRVGEFKRIEEARGLSGMNRSDFLRVCLEKGVRMCGRTK
jgi:hypothetical protein